MKLNIHNWLITTALQFSVFLFRRVLHSRRRGLRNGECLNLHWAIQVCPLIHRKPTHDRILASCTITRIHSPKNSISRKFNNIPKKKKKKKKNSGVFAGAGVRCDEAACTVQLRPCSFGVTYQCTVVRQDYCDALDVRGCFVVFSEGCGGLPSMIYATAKPWYPCTPPVKFFKVLRKKLPRSTYSHFTGDPAHWEWEAAVPRHQCSQWYLRVQCERKSGGPSEPGLFSVMPTTRKIFLHAPPPVKIWFHACPDWIRFMLFISFGGSALPSCCTQGWFTRLWIWWCKFSWGKVQ